MSCFRFIAAEKTNYPISLMCRVLGVSRSGFHAWEQRPPSERALADARADASGSAEMYARSRDSYGARRIYLDLRDEDVRVGRKRVERLMRAAGLSGYVKRRKFRTTFGVPGVRVADDLVERDFNPPAPNRLWASDIKYVSTWEGTLYLASVIDCFSRKVVGWSMRADMQAELVVDALEMAIEPPAAGRGARPSLRPGLAVRRADLRPEASQGRDRAVDGLEGRLLRQRRLRELPRHAREGAAPQPLVQDPAGGEDGDLRLDRGLVQPRRAATPDSATAHPTSTSETMTVCRRKDPI